MALLPPISVRVWRAVSSGALQRWPLFRRPAWFRASAAAVVLVMAEVTAGPRLQAQPGRELTEPARSGQGALPPGTTRIGSGGDDGFVTVDARGALHVVYGGKYRTGPAPDKLGPEEILTDITPCNGVRIAIDGRGRPHVVFTAGMTRNARETYYTTRVDGRWIPVEKFADAADFPDRTRAYVADVAVNEAGHALVSFWVSRPDEQRTEFDDPSFYYRWRSPAGDWSEPRSLSAHWSSSPKVEHLPGSGFLLLWQHRRVDWRIAGPVTAGGTFRVEASVPSGSALLGSQVQNEGADFSVDRSGRIVVAGNRRERFEGPVGIWAATGTLGSLEPAVYLGSFPGTKRGDESGLHAVTTFDAATGDAFVCVLNRESHQAVFTVFRRGDGWQQGYTRLLPEHSTPQGTLRQGPSLADMPGPGVIALVRDGARQWYLRVLMATDAASPGETP